LFGTGPAPLIDSRSVTSADAWLLRGALPRSEAVVLMAMLGFVIYLLVLLWALAEPCVGRLWCALGALPTLA